MNETSGKRSSNKLPLTKQINKQHTIKRNIFLLDNYIMSSPDNIELPRRTWLGFGPSTWFGVCTFLMAISTLLIFVFIYLTIINYSAVKLSLIFVFLVTAGVLFTGRWYFNKAEIKELCEHDKGYRNTYKNTCEMLQEEYNKI